MNDKITPLRKGEILMEVGGPVDECRATIAIYGDHLDPDAVSDLLGCLPTTAHRNGDRKTPTAVPFTSGAWLLTVEVNAPQGPDEAISELLARLPKARGAWQSITDQYSVSIRVGIHTSGWNRGFALSADVLAQLARIEVPVDFDLYLYGDEEEGDV
jgi:hypothetical protein